MEIIDTHAHLYGLSDVLADLAAAHHLGVGDIIVPGVDLASNLRHVEISCDLLSRAGGAVSFPRLHLALGLHPGNITTADDTRACFSFMREQLRWAVAVGETGLDYLYPAVRKDEAKRNEQREVFQKHLELACEFALPVIIHSRGAWRECLDMTLAAGVRRAEFHWYSGPLDILEDIVNAGFFVSFSPALEYSPECRRAAQQAPLDRILIETDTPVAYPVPMAAGDNRKERAPSAPCDIWRSLRALSAIKFLDEGVILQAVNANARTLFNI